jgi:methylmalonyl-CoA mutase C-terminal domain/subunit
VPSTAEGAAVELLYRHTNGFAPHRNTSNFRPHMRPIRVLVAKPGLDGHDRGAKVVAAALRDAGMEVIYTGLHQTPEMIATAAIQEDVDVIGLSILSGAHMTLIPRVIDLVRAQGRDDMLITGGGIIPKEDMDALEAKGCGRLFGPGTPTSELIEYIRNWFEGASRETSASGSSA